MTDLEREIHREQERAKKRRAFEAAGQFIHVCVTCGEGDPLCLILEHAAGQARDDVTFLMCVNCHAKRSCYQREEPAGSNNHHNVFEVIGRWLLGMAGYFEILMTKLRQFGEFLIALATDGHGDDLSFT